MDDGCHSDGEPEVGRQDSAAAAGRCGRQRTHCLREDTPE